MRYKFTVLFTMLMLVGTCTLLLPSQSKAAEYPAYTLAKGESKKIKTIVKNNPLTKNSSTKKIKWKSKNSAIVKVSGTKIHGVKNGTTYVRGYRNGKKKIVFKVTVGTPTTKLTVSSSSVKLMAGETYKVTKKISPSSASNKKVFYTSSNTKIAKVSSKGTITPVSGGNAKVYVNTKDGRLKKTISVKVYSSVIRRTSYGTVRGKSLANGLVWYGIPYGADTSGKNRWKAPKEPASWTGTKSMVTQKAGAAQYGNGSTTYIGTEDCLYVNVFRPNTNSTNLPVMVYLHGGGNASSNCNRNFSALSKETNSVIIAVEYRLGAFGFLSHRALRNGTAEENSGNFTMLDIQKALKWVQTNATNFGGNKSNVTLAGYSAGARDVMFCLISPIMKGLFNKAITFSGGGKTCTNQQGETSVESKLSTILVRRGTFTNTKDALYYLQNKATNTEIRQILDGLTTAEIANMYMSPALRLDNFPQGFNDGIVIDADGFEAIKKGKYNRVPIMLGSCTTEFSSFAWSSQYVVTPDQEAEMGTNTLGLLAQTIKYGSMLQSYHYIEEPAQMFMSDASHKSVYAYRYNWGTDVTVTGDFYSAYVGAYHGNDVNALLGNYPNNYQQYAPNAISTSNESGRLALTTKMRKYLKNFMKSGNPNAAGLSNWNVWDNVSTNKMMMFQATSTADVSAMTSLTYNQTDIFNQMRTNLTELAYDTIIDYPLKGRFFMPNTIPEY